MTGAGIATVSLSDNQKHHYVSCRLADLGTRRVASPVITGCHRYHTPHDSASLNFVNPGGWKSDLIRLAPSHTIRQHSILPYLPQAVTLQLTWAVTTQAHEQRVTPFMEKQHGV